MGQVMVGMEMRHAITWIVDVRVDRRICEPLRSSEVSHAGWKNLI